MATIVKEVHPSKTRKPPNRCKCGQLLSIYNLNDLCYKCLYKRRNDPRFVEDKPHNGWKFLIGG